MKVPELLKYPIGTFSCPEELSVEQIDEWLSILSSFPERLQKAVGSLDNNTLDTPYRNGTWTIRQLVHHIADSHTHAYIRFKWAKAHPGCVIKDYDEGAWSDFIDAKEAPVINSLEYIELLYKRWIYFLKTLSEEDYLITYIHPSGNQQKSLFFTLGQYVWHGEHHLSQIVQKINS